MVLRNNFFSSSRTDSRIGVSRIKKLRLLGAKINTRVDQASIFSESTKNSSRDNLTILHRNALLSDMAIDEMTSLEEIERRQQYYMKHKKYTFNPSKKIIRIFKTFMIFMVCYSSMSSLYFLAFDPKNKGAEISDSLVSLFFLADCVLTFFTRIEDKTKQKIGNLFLIAKKYAKGWLILDIASLLPLRYAGHPNIEHLLRLLRLGKMKAVFDLLNIYKISEFFTKLIYPVECLSKRKLKLKIEIIWNIIKEVLKIFFGAFAVACLWYSFVDKYLKYTDEKDNFILHFNLDQDTTVQRFIKTWYYIYTTLATVGYGDYYATNKSEMVAAIFLLLAGPTWFAFMMGRSIQLINNLQDIDGVSNKLSKLHIWISNIEGRKNYISYGLKDKILTHFTDFWKNDRLGTICIDSIDDETVVEESKDPFFKFLPGDLKRRLTEHLFSDILYDYYQFFKPLEEKKYILALYLQPRIYQKGSIMLREGDTIHEIIFLVSGRIQLGIFINETFKEYANFRSKFILGDYFFLEKIPSFLEFRALTNIRGFSLPANVLKIFLRKYRFNYSNYLAKLTGKYNRLQEMSEADITYSSHFTEINTDRRPIPSATVPYLKGKLFRGVIKCFIPRHYETTESTVKRVLEDTSEVYKNAKKTAKSTIKTLRKILIKQAKASKNMRDKILLLEGKIDSSLIN
ncbi:hypothetical protein SteCoe_6964 [Stentor coeruleus]|uniref:Cyclic nucleotide-binding domain-containing protein n=1 Tax=Stentor coeruleus TaxID=5963 RepID=A0A1R2CNX7_9CILI|nr:hypothetical protein SteCoe_6964 [Stentor coeruleus]